MEDQEIRTRIWEGSFPISIQFTDTTTTTPLYTMVSRHTYLPLLTSLLKSYFNLVQVPSLQTTDLRELPAHYPVGLLYDLFGNNELPWKLMIVITPSARTEILGVDETQLKAHFMSSIKEGDCLRYGSAKRVMNLSKKDQSCLWETLLERHATSLYWNVMEKLISYESEMLHVPFKLYLIDRNSTTDQTTTSSTMMVIQDLVPVKDTLVRELLLKCVPDFMDNKVHDLRKPYELVLHGVPLSLETPLQWLIYHGHYADTLLHFCLRPRPKDIS